MAAVREVHPATTTATTTTTTTTTHKDRPLHQFQGVRVEGGNETALQLESNCNTAFQNVYFVQKLTIPLCGPVVHMLIKRDDFEVVRHPYD